VKDSGGAVACGVLIGLGGSLAVARVASGLLYRVSPADPWVLGVAMMAVVGAAGVAVLVPLYQLNFQSMPPTIARGGQYDSLNFLITGGRDVGELNERRPLATAVR